MSSMSQVHGNHTGIEYDSDAYHLHDSLHQVGIEYESDTNHYMIRTNHYMISSTLGPARHGHGRMHAMLRTSDSSTC